MFSFENPPDPLLMIRIRVGVEKADRHRSNPEPPYPSRNPDSLRRAKRFQDPPSLLNLPWNLKLESSGTKGSQTFNQQIEELSPFLSPIPTHAPKHQGLTQDRLGNLTV